MLESLTVIIPSFNGAQALTKTLAELKRQQLAARVLVIDGGSSDSSQAVVLEHGFDLLEVQNHGYGHALNRGIEHSSTPFLALMNSDVLMPQATLEAAVLRLQNPRLGAVGPLPLCADGSRQHSFSFLYLPNHLKIDKPLPVKMLHGYCLLTRRDVLERVGGFDERFFMYNEEYDWCWRVLKAGYALEMIPQSAIHFGGASTPKNPDIFFEGRRGGMLLVDKHFPKWVAEPTRRFFQLEAWLYGLLTRDQAYKKMWQRLEAQMKSGDYNSAALPLSQRAEVRF
ncbi:MAG: glycosyltransferase family 2 protein [Deinococcales bacterium]